MTVLSDGHLSSAELQQKLPLKVADVADDRDVALLHYCSCEGDCSPATSTELSHFTTLVGAIMAGVHTRQPTTAQNLSPTQWAAYEQTPITLRSNRGLTELT